MCRGESRNEEYEIIVVCEPDILRVYLHFTAKNIYTAKILQVITVSYCLEYKSFDYATNNERSSTG